MKLHNIMSVLLFLYSSAYGESELQAPHSFGKTHFIVGYESEKPSTIPHVVQEEHKAVYFSPEDNPRSAFLSLIRAEQESIKIAIYMFTDSLIAQELIAAHKRGVRVEVITDPTCLKEASNKIGTLCDAGIDIFVYSPASPLKSSGSLMHNKFAIFAKNKNNKSLLWTGSFNFTKAASLNNQENVIVLDDAHFINRFSHQFHQLKGKTYAYNTLEMPSIKSTVMACRNNKNTRKNHRKKYM